MMPYDKGHFASILFQQQRQEQIQQQQQQQQQQFQLYQQPPTPHISPISTTLPSSGVPAYPPQVIILQIY